jgi:hypothetical protein
MRLSFGETPVGACGRSKINVPNPLWGSYSAFFFLTRIEYRTDLFSVSFPHSSYDRFFYVVAENRTDRDQVFTCVAEGRGRLPEYGVVEVEVVSAAVPEEARLVDHLVTEEEVRRSLYRVAGHVDVEGRWVDGFPVGDALPVAVVGLGSGLGVFSAPYVLTRLAPDHPYSVIARRKAEEIYVAAGLQGVSSGVCILRLAGKGVVDGSQKQV